MGTPKNPFMVILGEIILINIENIPNMIYKPPNLKKNTPQNTNNSRWWVIWYKLIKKT